MLVLETICCIQKGNGNFVEKKVVIVVVIVAIIVIVIGVSVSSSSFSIPHCHSGTTLPFLLLPLLLAMACYSGFPGVFALRGSSGVATLLRLTLATAVPVSGSAFALPGSSGAETKFRVVVLDSVQL